jgi:hypothetical protein
MMAGAERSGCAPFPACWTHRQTGFQGRLPVYNWGIVQRQYARLWIWLSRFESWFPSHISVPSSSGLGRRPLTPITRVRVPLGSPRSTSTRFYKAGCSFFCQIIFLASIHAKKLRGQMHTARAVRAMETPSCRILAASFFMLPRRPERMAVNLNVSGADGLAPLA